jgi:hypothetical protein
LLYSVDETGSPVLGQWSLAPRQIHPGIFAVLREGRKGKNDETGLTDKANIGAKSMRSLNPTIKGVPIPKRDTSWQRDGF